MWCLPISVACLVQYLCWRTMFFFDQFISSLLHDWSIPDSLSNYYPYGRCWISYYVNLHLMKFGAILRLNLVYIWRSERTILQWLIQWLSKASDVHANVFAVTYWHIWEAKCNVRNGKKLMHPCRAVEQIKAHDYARVGAIIRGTVLQAAERCKRKMSHVHVYTIFSITWGTSLHHFFSELYVSFFPL
jgi:hypothetical protein